MEILKKVLARFKSPVVWGGVIAVLGLLASANNMQFTDFTTWETIVYTLKDIVLNPVKLFGFIVAVFAFINNAGSKKTF
jgi:hypothetical protein